MDFLLVQFDYTISQYFLFRNTKILCKNNNNTINGKLICQKRAKALKSANALAFNSVSASENSVLKKQTI